MHEDHVGSLSQFLLYMQFVYNKKVTVYSKCERMQEYLDITGALHEGYELKTGSDNIEFIKTEHKEGIDCYGFKLNINNKSLVYTGDTSTLDPFLPYLKDCDEFYVDTSKNGGVHLKFEENFDALKAIKDNGTDVFLMHLDDIEYIKKVNNNEFFVD